MLEKITQIIKDYKGDDSIFVSKDTVIKNELGMNSFDLIQLVCLVEDEFDIEIPDAAIKKFNTIADVILFIENS